MRLKRYRLWPYYKTNDRIYLLNFCQWIRVYFSKVIGMAYQTTLRVERSYNFMCFLYFVSDLTISKNLRFQKYLEFCHIFIVNIGKITPQEHQNQNFWVEQKLCTRDDTYLTHTISYINSTTNVYFFKWTALYKIHRIYVIQFLVYVQSNNTNNSIQNTLTAHQCNSVFCNCSIKFYEILSALCFAWKFFARAWVISFQIEIVLTILSGWTIIHLLVCVCYT